MPLHVPSIICIYLCSHSELSRLIKRIDTVNQNTDLKLILCSKHAVNLEIAMSKGLLELLSLLGKSNNNNILRNCFNTGICS